MVRQRYRWPVIIDPSSKEDWQCESTSFDRHALYGRRYAQLVGDSGRHLTVLQFNARHHSVSDEMVASNLRVVTAPHTSLLRGKIRQRLLPHVGDITWIMPDPFTYGLLERFRLRDGDDWVQVQAHGDFGSPNFVYSGIQGLLKRHLAQRGFTHGDSIRAVGPTQAENLIRRFRVPPEKLLVTPIPISSAFLQPPRQQGARSRNVVFVGRLHSERGLRLWASVACTLAERHRNLTFEIAGSGPEEATFRRLLSSIEGDRVRWHGWLSAEKVRDLFDQSSIMLTTPSFESYGRSIVEALCRGVRVVATQTAGALDLSYLANLRLAASRSELIGEVDSLLANSGEPSDQSKVIAHQTVLNEVSVSKLVSSWL